MVKKIVIVILAIISLALIDVFSRFLYAQSWFSTTTFSKELDPFDILSLIVTTIVTFWFGWYISKKLTEQRYQKEYVINDLKQIEEELCYIERSMQSSNIDLENLLDNLNKLNTYIKRFCKTVEIFKISTIDVKNLNKFYNLLYSKTTNVESSQLVLDATNRNEINQVCADFVIETRGMIFTINKH